MREKRPRVRASREDARHRRRRRDGVPAVIHVLRGRFEELRTRTQPRPRPARILLDRAGSVGAWDVRATAGADHRRR